jgi:hypothetical protein
MSNDDVERPIAGGNILRHKTRATDFTPAAAHAVHCEEIEAHLAQHVAPMDSVFHEILSDIIHLDVLWVKATAERPFHLLVTSGMSDLPMTVPEAAEGFRHAELFMVLPPQWNVGNSAEDDYWPIRWLKQVGRLPHEYETWIGDGHTIPNGDPPEPIANTKFVGVMATAQYPLPDEFRTLTAQDGATIHFYQLLPLFAEEMDLKLDKGSDELMDRFGKQNIDFVFDAQRPNVALKRGWFRW